MLDSAEGLQMPPFPKERFLEAVDQVVEANLDWVPPYGTGASLYLHLFIFGSKDVIAIKPAEEFQFRLYATPVGPYFKGGINPLTLRVSKYDRAAPRGTGQLKAGLNYAMSLNTTVKAHEEGYDENLFLDAATRTYVEESGGANIIFITEDKELVTPKSSSILPSITKRSILYLAENYLDLKVSERPVKLEEVKDFAEAGLCGTAAVISPVGKIVNGNQEITFLSGMDNLGPIIKKLYEKSIEVLNERGVTLSDIAELVKKLQEPYDPDIKIEVCYENVDAVLKKREVAHAILTGVALDRLAEKKELPEQIQSIIDQDEGLYGIDEIIPLSIVNLYGTIGLTSYGFLDKEKIGIIKELDTKKDGKVNTFLDDLVVGIAAAAASRYAHGEGSE
jgi:branched-chain amino acid aminotransferase group II